MLRMAARVADFPPLADASLREERRSPTCGSRMTVTLDLADDGTVRAIGLDAKACALGQAAAAIMALGAKGRSAVEIAAAGEAWRGLSCRGDRCAAGLAGDRPAGGRARLSGAASVDAACLRGRERSAGAGGGSMAEARTAAVSRR